MAEKKKRATAKKKTAKKKAIEPDIVENKGGRPTKYKPEYCQLIIDIMSRGESVAAFCAHVRVSRQTYLNWAQTYPEFFEASQVAMACSQLHWENLAKLCATGQIRNYEVKDASGNVTKPYKYANPAMIMFMMSRRFPDYHRRVMQNVSIHEPDFNRQNQDTYTIDVSRLTTKQLEAIESAAIGID